MSEEKRCDLPPCWEIENCGREPGGINVHDKGECIAAQMKMGHSCWAVAGTLCKGEVQGTIAQKIGFCTACEVHKRYNRSMGTLGQEVCDKCPDEQDRYIEIMIKQSGVL